MRWLREVFLDTNLRSQLLYLFNLAFFRALNCDYRRNRCTVFALLCLGYEDVSYRFIIYSTEKDCLVVILCITALW